MPIDFIRNNSWCWESPETELGIFYIERQGKQFFAFHNATMLHSAKHPLRSLSVAIQRCEDVFHQLKWGDRC